MAALLGHGAARRLGGSTLQRAEVEGRRRLGPRLLHTEEQSREEIGREINEKKEQLYNLMAKAEKNTRTRTMRNSVLLWHLSDEVTPRPHDKFWCDLQATRSGCKLRKKHGLYALAIVLPLCYNSLERWWKGKDLA